MSVQCEIRQELIEKVASKITGFVAIGLLKTVLAARGADTDNPRMQGEAMFAETQQDAIQEASVIVDLILKTAEMGEIVK